MNYRFALLGALTVLAVPLFAQPSTEGPPKKGQPLQWTGAWHTKATLHPAVKQGSASTTDAIRFFPSPTREPNEEMDELVDKSHLVPPPGGHDTQPASSESIAVNSLLTTSEGIGQTSLTPPDNDIAVGSDYTVEVVNSTWRISDKAGNVLYENTINNFLGDNGFLFDPKVFFDPWRARWSMLWHRQDSGAHTAHLVTVSSDDDNPLGTWYYYYFQVDNGGVRWTDYADWGYGSGGVFAAGDEFTFGNSFQFVRFFTFNPSEIYSNGGASVVWNDFANNPDGTQAFAPRVAKQLNNGLGGGVFINSRYSGASKLTVWLLADPLGAHTFSNYDIGVNAYTPPPTVVDPGGNGIATNACQMMPAYLVFHPGVGKWRLATSLNTNNPSQPGTVASKLYVIDPFAHTLELDWNFWVSTNSVWFASPVVSYQDSLNWVMTWGGPSRQAGAAYCNMEGNSFTNTIGQIKAGASNYGGGRWGDYHGGSPDWGDYYNGMPTQKQWMTGEYAKGTFTWATYNGATLGNGFNAGTMLISGATSMTFSGYVGGGFSPASYQNVVNNTGSVGFNWGVSTPSWLSPDIAGGEVYGSQAVNVGTNANANSKPFGHYSGNVTYKNNYNGTTSSVPADLLVYSYITPSSFAVKLGKNTGGNLASFGSVDNNFFTMCKFLVPNLVVAPVQVEINGTAPSTSVGYVDFLTFVKMQHGGTYKLTMEMWNWLTNNWDTTDVLTAALNQSVQRFDLVSTGNDARFIGSGNALKAKYSIKETGPSAVALWCANTDLAGWIIAPP